MNVLHAPFNTGSQPASLAAAENLARRRASKRGRSWSVDFNPSRVTAESDDVFRRLPGFRGKARLAAGPFLYALRRAARFEVLHLYFGASLFWLGKGPGGFAGLDLPLWKALGKRVFATFLGCDARLRGPSARRTFAACRKGVCDVEACHASANDKKQRTIEQFSRWADKLFCVNPDLLSFVPRAEFLPYANLPADLPKRSPPSGQRALRIVHAPTSRAIKGTRHVTAASEGLQKTRPHELCLVENTSRREALRLYAEADILVDQLHVGWYGGLAVEAMAMGLPVVAFLREDDLGRIPQRMQAELPIVRATPVSLPAVLRQLLEDSELRRQAAQRGPEFVRRWHDPVKIARRMLELYDDPSQSFWTGYGPRS